MFSFSATGCIVPFLPTLAKQLGFSGVLVGTVYTILPISGLIAKPLFGSLADKYKLHKSFFLFFQAFLTISFFIMHFIPEVVTSADTRLKCDNSEAFLELCPEKLFSQDVLNNVISSNKSEGDCQVIIFIIILKFHSFHSIFSIYICSPFFRR